MSIEYSASTAIFTETVGVEDAEELLRWLLDKPGPIVDLSACTHLHPSNLQVLMATKANIVSWPEDPSWRNWLESALHNHQGDA